MSGEENREKRKYKIKTLSLKKPRLELPNGENVCDTVSTEAATDKEQSVARAEHDSHSLFKRHHKKSHHKSTSQSRREVTCQTEQTSTAAPDTDTAAPGPDPGHDVHYEHDYISARWRSERWDVRAAAAEGQEEEERTQQEPLDLSRPGGSGMQAPESGAAPAEPPQEDYELSDAVFNQINADLHAILNPLSANSILNDGPVPHNDSIIELGDSFTVAPPRDPPVIEVVDLMATPTPLPRRFIPPGCIIDLVDDSPGRPASGSAVPQPSLLIEILDSDDEGEGESKAGAVGTTDSKPALECPVCLESLKNKKIMSTTCGHIFCSRCIRRVVKKSRCCPNCRKRLTSSNIHPLYVNL